MTDGSSDEPDYEGAFGIDTREITRRVANDNLRETIEAIGEEKFERFDASVDVESIDR